MKRTLLAILGLVASMLLVCAAPVSAQCNPQGNGLCLDCINGTPCCGYGPCNFLCFNCDGGCRRGTGPGGSTTCPFIPSAAASVEDNLRGPSTPVPDARAGFDAIDTNRNGTLSLGETKAWAKRHRPNATRKEIAAGFKAIDANGDRKLAPGEVDRSLAATDTKR